MKQKGYIVEVIAYKRYYTISSLAGDNVILFFEELSGDKYKTGDLIEYEVVTLKEFGQCALNPKKIGNIYLDELKMSLNNNNTIKGYVYGKNVGGYLVSYNGYQCFLPISFSVYENLKPSDDFLNTYQLFYVKLIKKDGSVILTRRPLLKEKLREMTLQEIADIKIGFEYIGKVKSSKYFGVFITYKYAEGLLHISKILTNQMDRLSKKEKKKLELIFNEVFVEGREILVTVDEINDTQFSVIWDKNVAPNREICLELMSYGLST